MQNSFGADVSRSQLLALREEGLTNQEIAERFDVCYGTILKAIGPQPKGLRKKPGPKKEKRQESYGFMSAYAVVSNNPIPEPPKKEPEQEACLLVEGRIICLEGSSGRSYEVNVAKGEVRIKGGIEGEIAFKSIDELISELKAISRKIPSLQNTLEMW